jgi:hypothetical protein
MNVCTFAFHRIDVNQSLHVMGVLVLSAQQQQQSD